MGSRTTPDGPPVKGLDQGGGGSSHRIIAATLVALAGVGLCSPIATAQQGAAQAPAIQAQPTPAPPAVNPAEALQERNRRILEEQRLKGQTKPVAGTAPGLVVAPEELAPGKVAGGEIRALASREGKVTLNFPNEAVEIAAFADYVSKAIGANIYVDEGVGSQRILFRAPLEVPVSRLLPLLSAFVEDRGFALIQHPLGWYQVQPAANVIPNVQGDELSTTRVIRTPMVKPSALQAAVQTSLGQAAASVRITAFDEIGALIVTATPRTADAVVGLVDRLMQEVAGQSLTRLMLENIAADFARERVLVLNGRLATAGGLPGNAQQGGAAAVGALSNLESRLIVDQGNSLIFRGSESEASSVRELVAMVDVVTPMIARRYAVGASVQEVARTCQELGLGTVREARQTGGGGFGGGFRGAQPGGFGASQPQETGGSNFTVDAESGSFIYIGKEKQQEIVAEVVRTFVEQQTATRVEIKMYKLHNARAPDVAELLTRLIEDPSRRVGASPFLPGSRQGQANQPGASAAAQAALQTAAEAASADAAGAGVGGVGAGGGVSLTATASEVSIVADEIHNQIIIRASARQQAEFERIIKNLDQRQRQVYIEAQIVSVRTNDNFTWTVETQINAGQFLLFSNFGLSVPQTVNGQPTGVKQVPGGNRGLTTSLIKSDFLPFVLQTLQTNADARIISNPRLLVLENSDGSVSSQRTEPFSVTSQGTATTTTGQGGTANAGTTLTVNARISEGGYITLIYTFELSSFDRTVAQAQGLQPPSQNENYSAEVQVPSDSTIVVGGFTLESTDESNSRVPILGDIPIIGELFKSFSRNKTKTTIFLFITPTIMSDPDSLDLRLASEGPMRDMLVDDQTPELEPAVIPISQRDLATSAVMKP